MDCKIEYNKQGKIVRVLTPTGEESSLYKQLAKMPFNTPESALEIYKQTLENFDQDSVAIFKTEERTFETYKEALIESNGKDIEVQVDGKVLQVVSSNTNPSTLNGLVNNAIKSSILSDTLILEDGEVFYKAEGYNDLNQIVKEEVLKQFANENSTFVTVKKDGKITLYRGDELKNVKNKTFSEASKEVGEQKALLATGFGSIVDSLFNKTNRPIRMSNQALIQKITNTLNKAGFKVTTIENYTKNYADKNGVEPNAQGLIDLTNKIVAFAEGQTDAEVVTEEFAHFMLEALPQDQMENAIRNVVSTEEYAEFSEMYREVYAKDTSMSKEEVEAKVRKEILGQIVAKGVREKLSPKSQSIFEYLYNLIVDFINSLPILKTKREVNSLIDAVIDTLMMEDASKLNTDFRELSFYSLKQAPASEKIRDVLKVLLATTKDQEQAFRKGRFTNSESIEKAREALATTEAKTSVLTSVDFVSKQVAFVERAIQESKNDGSTVSPEHSALAVSLKGNVQDILVKLGEYVKKDSILSPITSEIDSLKLRIVNLDTAPDDTVKDNIIRRAMIRHQMPDNIKINGETVSTYDYFMNAIDTVSKDTNAIYAYIGQVSHAKDPILNLIDSVIFDMISRQNIRFTERAYKFQNFLESKGFSPKNFKNFVDEGGYILSVYDFSKFDNEVLNITAKHFHENLVRQNGGIDVPSLEEIKDSLKNRKDFKTEHTLRDNFKDDFSKAVSQEISLLRERTYKDEYYTAQNAEIESLGISKEATDKIRQLNFDRADIMGRVDMSLGYPALKAQEKIDLDAYNTERNLSKSLYDEDGLLKEGLILLTESQFRNRYKKEFTKDKFIYDNGFVKVGNNFVNIQDTASVESKIAYGITKADANFIEKNKETVRVDGIPESFYETLNKLPTEDSKREFILSNVNFGISDSFFTPVIDEFEEALNSGDNKFEEKYNELVSLQNTRRELLKRHRDSKNSTNVLGSKMSSSEQERVKELTKAIISKKSEMYAYIGEKPKEFQIDDTLESDINEDYKQHLRDLGIESNYIERLQFARRHMTSDNTFNLVLSSLELLKLGTGLNSFMEKTLQRSLDSIGVDISSIESQIEVINSTSKSRYDKDLEVDRLLASYSYQLAEKRIAPYFKAIAPKQVGRIMDELHSTPRVEGKENNPNYDKEVSLHFKNILDRLQQAGMSLRVHQTYYEQTTNGDINENKIANFKAYKVQPKLSLFLNPRFEERLKVTLSKDSKGNYIIDEYGIPQVEKESEEFEVYKEYVKFRAVANENTNSLESDNIYLMPQVSKTFLDKSFSSVSGKGKALPLAKEFLKELTAFRTDEQIQGETNEAGDSLFAKTGLRIVPKRYFTKLETEDDVSSDLFYSTMMMVKESELHRARKEALTEVTALENALKTKKFENGKEAIATNTWKMAKSYIDYNIYGISESKNYRTSLPILGTVDFAKVAKMFHQFVRWKNLAFNAIIPMTSWLTAEANIVMEQWIGQYLDKDSMYESRKITAKLFADSAKEWLTIHKKGRLNLIGEYFGVFEIDDNFSDSDKGRGARLLNKIPMGAHSAGNFSPVSQALVAGLVGHRIANFSVLITKEELKELNPSLTPVEVEVLWQGFNENVFLDKRQFKEKFKLINPNKSQKDIDEEWVKIKNNSLYEFIGTENGYVELDYERLSKALETQNNEQFKKDVEDVVVRVSGKVRKFVERIDGNIPQHEKTMLQRNYLGTFLMTHKGWQSIAITNRFKSSHYNLQTEQVEEGSYITLMQQTRAVADKLTEAIKDKKPLNELLKIARDTFYGEASEYQKSNIQRVGKDLALSSALFMIAVILNGFADDDDNKDNYLVQMTSLLTNRVFNETKSAQVGLVDEIISTVQNPVVGFDNILKSLQFWNAVNFSDSTAKKYSGHSKAFEYAFDNLPFLKNPYVQRDASSVQALRNSYNHFNDPDSFNIASLLVSSKEIQEMFFGGGE